jgi:hypothetical protein
VEASIEIVSGSYVLTHHSSPTLLARATTRRGPSMGTSSSDANRSLRPRDLNPMQRMTPS